jgi:hypothetical protein
MVKREDRVGHQVSTITDFKNCFHEFISVSHRHIIEAVNTMPTPRYSSARRNLPDRPRWYAEFFSVTRRNIPILVKRAFTKLTSVSISKRHRGTIKSIS